MAEPTKSTESTENAAAIPAVLTTPETTTTHEENTSPAPPPKPLSPHQQALATLQEAFPSVEPGVIEAILEIQHGNMEAAFEVLLGMSDPDYQAPATTDDQYALEQQEKEDALLAKRLAQQYDQQQQQQQRQQQPQPQRQDSESVFSGFQEELPVIKERVIEAGNAAKKKIMGFYNSFMDQSSSSSPQETMTNDMRGLRLDSKNPQMDDDAAFARRLAMEDAQLERLSAQRLKQQSEKKGVQVEEGDAVTFTTPDTKPAYLIHDDDDELDLYGAAGDQGDEKRKASKEIDAKTEHKQD